jgi:diaminopimelate epimerase
MKLDILFFYQSGNATALIKSAKTNLLQKKGLNDLILGTFPNIEQVGFTNFDPLNLELEMAGGEFCGNATRSTAWQVLKGEPGDITIKVSGVENKLRAGVTSDGEAYAEMPVYADPSKIRIDTDNPGNYYVEMEGITHYVDFNPTKIKGFTDAELEEEARSSLKEKNLMEGPAAGIIYTERQPDGLKITPVVYVRDIDTLFVETACGSGTAAVGLALAKETGNDVIEVPIIQPTGVPINVSVNYNGQKFGYTQISGLVKQIGQASLSIRKDNYCNAF